MKTSLFDKLRKPTTIVLSAGHGDGDPGAVNGNFKEAEQAIVMVDEIAKQLTKAGLTVDVVPHENGLKGAIKYINQRYDAGDAWAIEIHRDSADGLPAEQASLRCGVYYYPSQGSTEIATFLAGALRRFGAHGTSWARPDTDSRHGTLAWVRQTEPVAHLLELGFMEGENSKAHLLKLAGMAAQSLYEAFTGVAWDDETTELPAPDVEPESTAAPTPLVAVVATPAATLLDQLATAYKAKDLGALFKKLNSKAHSEDLDDLQNASLAQWILESGWAKSGLARDHFNFGGLKWRKEMEAWATEDGIEVKPVKYTAWDGPDTYCKFASPSAYIDGYWRFIMRDPYENWEDHASNPKDYISYLLKCGYTTSDTYLGEVMSLVPKAMALLGGASALPSAVPAAAVPEATSSAEAKGKLAGKQIAVVVGHEMAGNGNKYEGGANGERTYNKVVAKHMKELLEAEGAEVFVYEHKIKAYTARQNAMAAAVKKALPKCWVSIELHYDDMEPDPKPNGHHFQYREAKNLALAIRDEFERRFPGWARRADDGIKRNLTENGAGFLAKAPGATVLVEPFFRSNPKEWAFFSNRHREVAEAYCVGIANFA